MTGIHQPPPEEALYLAYVFDDYSDERAGLVHGSDFYEEKHRDIYQALIKTGTDSAVTVETMAAELPPPTLQYLLSEIAVLDTYGGEKACIKVAKQIRQAAKRRRAHSKAVAVKLTLEQGNDATGLIEELTDLTRAVNEELSGNRSNHIKVVTAVELMTQEFPPREKLLDPWLPSQGLAMLYAPRGVGKTHCSLGIAHAVASGGEFLGWQAPAASSVLFLDGEMPGVALQERLAMIAASSIHDLKAPLRFITPDMQALNTGMIDISRPEDQAALEPHLDGVKLIVLDNLSTLCRGGRENEGESWLPVQAWCLRQRAAGRSVLLIHHTGKNGEQRGSSRREDVLDTVISLRRPGDYTPDKGACFEIHFEKARGLMGTDVNPFEAQLTADPISGLQVWTIKGLEQSTAEKVAALLNEGIAQHEIADLLKLSKGAVSKAKHRAAAMGLMK